MKLTYNMQWKDLHPMVRENLLKLFNVREDHSDDVMDAIIANIDLEELRKKMIKEVDDDGINLQAPF